MHPVKMIHNITRHNTLPYKIHNSKQVPFIKNKDQTKIEESKIFIIETFNTTRKDYMIDSMSIYILLYMIRN